MVPLVRFELKTEDISSPKWYNCLSDTCKNRVAYSQGFLLPLCGVPASPYPEGSVFSVYCRTHLVKGDKTKYEEVMHIPIPSAVYQSKACIKDNDDCDRESTHLHPVHLNLSKCIISTANFLTRAVCLWIWVYSVQMKELLSPKCPSKV